MKLFAYYFTLFLLYLSKWRSYLPHIGWQSCVTNFLESESLTMCSFAVMNGEAAHLNRESHPRPAKFPK